MNYKKKKNRIYLKFVEIRNTLKLKYCDNVQKKTGSKETTTTVRSIVLCFSLNLNPYVNNNIFVY